MVKRQNSEPSAHRIIGAAIRQFREQDGRTLEELAAKAGISYQYLSGIETGKENFSIGILEKITLALGLTPAFVVASGYTQP